MKILMLGDSITHGYTTGGGVTPYTLASTIASETGNDVINGGINGTEVFAGDDSFTTEVEQHNFADYDMVMIMYGSNDIGREGETIDDFKRGYQQGIYKILSDNPKIDLRLITMIPDYRHDNGNEDWKNKLGLSQRMVNDAVKEIAQKNGGKVFDWRANGIITSADQLLPDHLHPTDATYQAMGKALANWIKDDSPQPQPSDDTDILSAIYEYKYLYFGFDPAGESKDNPWKATPVLCGSDDGINWTVIDHLPQLGNLRDGSIAIYKDWYYLIGTSWGYRTKNFKDFEELDTSFLKRDGFHDIWAPEFFTDLQGNWHIVWCANNGKRHVYVCDFDPETGTASNTWQQVDEDGGIDPHIWTHNGKYFLSIDGYWLYQSDSYLGPFELIKTDMVHEGENKTHWYEAGETLQIDNTLYFYMDHIDGSVPGVDDSGVMEVQTANIDDPTHWSGPQQVSCSINMRHGSFIKVNQQVNPSPEPTVSSLSLDQLSDDPFTLKKNVTQNVTSTVIAINSIYKFCERLLGTDSNSVRINTAVKNNGLDRVLRNFVVRSIELIQQEINEAVALFNANDFISIKTGEPIEYLSLNIPTMLTIDSDYKDTLNDDWQRIEDKINELFAIIKQFTKGE